MFDKDKEYLENIKNKIDINQMENILSELGGEPKIISDNIIISKTICHCGNSHKLFYYNNTKLFKCYTDCNDTWDIYQLIIKIKKNENINWSLPNALNYVIKFFNFEKQEQKYINDLINSQDWKIFNKYEQYSSQNDDKQIVELKKYDINTLKYFPHPHIETWEKEGINKDIMDKFGICYNPVSQGIIIPHFNEYGELIGIRERTLIKENENNGKYKPAIINNKMYNHPLGFNLYGLNFSKETIKKIQKAIVFEGEKSPMLYASYFGFDNNISVACCGSSLINYQVELLLKYNVKEIIIAYDKQFKEIGDDEWKRWTKKLIEINNKYGSNVQISYIFDKNNKLQYKSSPIDEGKEKFIEMFNERIVI